MSLEALTYTKLPDVPFSSNQGVYNFLMQLKRIVETLAGNKTEGDRVLTVNDIEYILSMIKPTYDETHGKYIERGAYYGQFAVNSSNSINMAVDGSTTPVEFALTVPDGQYYLVYRAIINYQDDGTWLPDGYGANGALANGITAHVEDANGNMLFTMNTHKNITTNSDWASFCFDTNLLDWGNPVGTKNLSARWTFKRDGSPILLLPGWSVVITINDDLTGLTDHTVRFGCVRGKYPLTEDIPASYPSLT